MRSAAAAEPVGFACQDLGYVYGHGERAVCALDDVSFSVRGREFLCIVGPSGCGKSTLLKIIAGLLEPTSGQLAFGVDASSGVSSRALVFQDHAVFPWMRVLENVAFGLEMQGVPKRERNERARDFVDRVGLTPFLHRYPHELSVGMQQRVGIARAFVSGAEYLLMDEPFGSLDAQTKRILQEELLQLWERDSKLVVFVTHDIGEAVRLGDRVLVMTGHPGRVLREVPVPLERPRVAGPKSKEANEIRWHIWQLLEEEIRHGLSGRG